MARRRALTRWDVLILGLLAVIVGVMVYPVFVRERNGRPNVCLSNVKNIALAVQMYLSDNDECFPPARDWCGVLDEYVKNRDVFRCPQARKGTEWAYAYNSLLSTRSMYDPADLANTVAIFESDAGKDAAGGPELLPDVPRHLGGDHWGFADGHVSWLKRKSAGGNGGERIWLKEPEKPVRWKP
jgi:hypothetical protein